MLSDHETKTRGVPGIGLALLLIALVSGGLAGTLAGLLLRDLPDPHILELQRPSLTTRILDRRGRMLSELFVERRSPVHLAQVSPTLVDAILAAEDSDFLHHPGLDPIGILRAAVRNLLHGRVVQGGSTITQQLVKLLFLSPERSFSRKIREAILALRLESLYTKERILELYMSTIYLGAGSYGVEAASNTYFGCSARRLSPAQAALLAGLAQAPSRYDPMRNPDGALQRRNHVLDRMRIQGFLDQEAWQAARKAPLGVRATEEGGRAPYFTEWVRLRLVEELGSSRVLHGGLTVHTTLDLEAQQQAEKALWQGLRELEERHPERPRPAGAILSLDHGIGAVRAMVGGPDFSGSQFNLATQARRRPGSGFKPFVMLVALEEDWTQATMVLDGPIRFGTWSPRNYSGRYHGSVTLREVLERSLNTATVRVLHQVGLHPLARRTRSLGFQESLPWNLTVALGTSSVTLLEMTQAYGAIASIGMLWPAYGIQEVHGPDGERLTPPLPRPRSVMQPRTAFVLRDMLQGVVHSGTGRRARHLGPGVGGKTGTTDDYVDAWFLGFDGTRTTGVWVGHPSREMGLGDRETGARAALPIWLSYMEGVGTSEDRQRLTPPEGIEMVLICRQSGARAGPDCDRVFRGAFIRGTAPVETCPLHRPTPPPGDRSWPTWPTPGAAPGSSRAIPARDTE